MATTQSAGVQENGLVRSRPADVDGDLFAPPAPRAAAIERPTLVGTLTGSSCPLVVVSAPAGYGKTTMLAQIAELDPRPKAWMRCTERDRDARSVLAHIHAALERCLDLGARHPVLLIMDDAHLIEGKRALDALLAVPDELPPGSTLMIATRHEVGSPAARMRSQGRIHEVGTASMAMDVDEAARLVRAFGVEASKEQVAALTDRTEGWPAALSLALVTAVDDHRTAELGAFGGTSRFMADYLRSEFLERNPDQVQFLTRTSIVRTLNGPLCDAVLGTTASAQVLASLAGTNGLVLPAADPGSFRYHKLYRGFLLAELDAREPELVAPLHAKAARWFREQGEHEKSVGHAFAADEPDLAADSIGRCGLAVFWRGGMATVRGWLTQLDDDTLLRWPSVAIEGAWVHSLIGMPAEADRWIDLAERGVPNDPPPDGSASVETSMARLRSMLCRDGVEQMQRDASFACEAEADWSVWRASSLLGLGIAYTLSGDLVAAERVWHEAVDIGREVGAIPGLTLTLSELARTAVGRGAWATAAELSDSAVSLILGAGLSDDARSALAYAMQARVALHEGLPLPATEHLERAIGPLPLLTYSLPWYAVQVRLEIGWALLALARPEEAETRIAEIDAIVWKRPGLGTLLPEIDRLRQAIVAGAADAVAASGLTPAELRLLPLLPTHLSFAEIGSQLFVSRSTVKTQAISIYRKLGVSSRGEAVEQARSMHLLDA